MILIFFMMQKVGLFQNQHKEMNLDLWQRKKTIHFESNPYFAIKGHAKSQKTTNCCDLRQENHKGINHLKHLKHDTHFLFALAQILFSNIFCSIWSILHSYFHTKKKKNNNNNKSSLRTFELCSRSKIGKIITQVLPRFKLLEHEHWTPL